MTAFIYTSSYLSPNPSGKLYKSLAVPRILIESADPMLLNGTIVALNVAAMRTNCGTSSIIKHKRYTEQLSAD
jgi:hypothetical protein